jgi:SAM-dependent methyltransferase
MPEVKGSLKHITCGEFSGDIETVACPICHSPPAPKMIFKSSNGIGIWLCPKCTIMYASPRFTEKSISLIYESDAFVDPSFYDHWSYEKWKRENKGRSYISQQLKIGLIKRFLKETDRILDVGCGTGLFCLEASKQGLNVEGIDPSKMLIDIGRKTFKIPLHQGLLEEFDPGYKYRGIVVWAVLEHVYDLINLVTRCGYLLEKEGYLFIDVPHYRGISNRFKTLMCRMGFKKNDFKHFGFPWHIYSFSKKSLSSLMRACGFEPILFEFWSHLLKNGADGFFAEMMIALTQKLALSDYITLVAQKKE